MACVIHLPIVGYIKIFDWVFGTLPTLIMLVHHKRSMLGRLPNFICCSAKTIDETDHKLVVFHIGLKRLRALEFRYAVCAFVDSDRFPWIAHAGCWAERSEQVSMNLCSLRYWLKIRWGGLGRVCFFSSITTAPLTTRIVWYLGFPSPT